MPLNTLQLLPRGKLPIRSKYSVLQPNMGKKNRTYCKQPWIKQCFKEKKT